MPADLDCYTIALGDASLIAVTHVPLLSSPAVTAGKKNYSCKKMVAAFAKYDDGMVKDYWILEGRYRCSAGFYRSLLRRLHRICHRTIPMTLRSEDPADVAVAILIQISVQSQPVFAERAKFEPDASSVHISCFRFLSLTFSLTSASCANNGFGNISKRRDIDALTAT
ncbi:hypothetical protein WG66_004537 [Moniliophthora roreri]|nr:hypothetical protein WG66_004537 [Moniliophthora roreri]